MITRDDLQSMDPYELEMLVADIWKVKGFETTVRAKSRDRGVDIVAEKPGTGWKEVIQVKRYGDGNKVGSQNVREYATLYQQIPDANAVVIVTSSEFTSEAAQLAADLRVETVTGDELVEEIERTGVSVASYVDTNGEAPVGTDRDEPVSTVGTEPGEIVSIHDSVVLNHEEVDPKSYVRQLSAPTIHKQPWKYPATAIDGVDFDLAECSDSKMNVVVSEHGIEYLGDEGKLHLLPLSEVANVSYTSYLMGLRKPTTVRFELSNGDEHVLTLRRGWKKRNVKHMAAFVNSLAIAR